MTTANDRRRVSAVVPTAGGSPLLGRCLAALSRDGGDALELVVVVQGEAAALTAAAGAGASEVLGLADRVLRLPANRGFAAATNHGVAAAGGDYVATVNDDALVEPGWLAALVAALDADPQAAAAQGTNLVLDRPTVVDGQGLAWNRWWQAVQVGRGGAPPPAGEPPREVFGVSATAALYRRAALDAVAAAPGRPFDERLGAYYEDVDLACRLRRAGWRALSVPAARALHAGSLTGGAMPRRRLAWIYGNRWAVAARWLGRGFPRALAAMAARDLADLGRALGRGELTAALGIAGGWARALRLLPGSLHRGRPLTAPEDSAGEGRRRTVPPGDRLRR